MLEIGDSGTWDTVNKVIFSENYGSVIVSYDYSAKNTNMRGYRQTKSDLNIAPIKP